MDLPDESQTLISAGRFDEVVARCADLLGGVDVEAVPLGGTAVFREVFRLAVALGRAGGTDAALEVIELVKGRFATVLDLRAKAYLAVMFSLEGDIRGRLGEHAEAIAAYDEELALLSLSARATGRGSCVGVLIGKAQALDGLGRYEEEIVVLDDALSAVKAADEATDGKRAGKAAMATFLKLGAYEKLGRHERALELGPALRAALADLPTEPADVATGAEVRSEPSLAAAVAEIVNDGECWAVFEGEKTVTTAVAAGHAMRLYRVSEPWALDEGKSPGPVDMATATVRDVADGYALLAVPRSDSERSDLSVPKRGEIERGQALRTFGVDEWSLRQGHPLKLPIPDPGNQAAQTPATSAELPGWEHVQESFVRGAVRMLFEIELVDILSRSAGGREALNGRLFTAMASNDLALTRRWLQQLAPLGPTDARAGVTIVFHLFAQGLFVTSHDGPEHATHGLATAARLRDLLKETGGHDWLVAHDVPLPAWTE